MTDSLVRGLVLIGVSFGATFDLLQRLAIGHREQEEFAVRASC
jgi:hypothetical protein